MGKGDKKSKRGKIVIGSFGVRRRRNKPKITGKPFKEKLEPVITEEKMVKPVEPIAEVMVKEIVEEKVTKKTATKKTTKKETESASETKPKASRTKKKVEPAEKKSSPDKEKPVSLTEEPGKE